jgi:hypothetical protein
MKKNKVLELFGLPTDPKVQRNWRSIITRRHCPYLERTCVKTRKSDPSVIIGTCTVAFGSDAAPIIICPHRLLERRQIFTDCLHWLTLHEPGNELHLVPEITIPGGHIDYMLVSARVAPPKIRKVVDFVAIELQSLDTTGTVWPERQRFLLEMDLPVAKKEASSDKSFGMNWKMTAKTILV